MQTRTFSRDTTTALRHMCAEYLATYRSLMRASSNATAHYYAAQYWDAAQACYATYKHLRGTANLATTTAYLAEQVHSRPTADVARGWYADALRKVCALLINGY